MPFTVRLVVEALPNVVWPLTFNVPEDVSPVVEAAPSTVCPVTLSVPEEVRPVEEAVVMMLWPVTLSVPPKTAFVPLMVVENISVPVAFVKKKLVDVYAVDDPFVITEELANIFCEKRLRNLSGLVPREKVTSAEGAMFVASVGT
jgi:hypothetical protein